MANSALASTPTVINTPGGDDSSYQIPLSAPVMFFGQQYTSIWATTNAVITFGRPDGTFHDFPMTPSISLGSQDWEAYAGRAGEQFVISYTDTAFQVDMIARPFGSGTGAPLSRLVLTGIINQDRTINFSYYLENTDQYPWLRFGVRTPQGQVMTLQQANFQESEAAPTTGGQIVAPPPSNSPTVSPEPSASPTVSPEPTQSQTVSPEPTESPTASPEPAESPSVSPETESQTVLPETSESSTVSPEPTESPSISPDPNRIELLVNEGDFLGYVAPEGYRIARVESASYGADNGCHAENSLTIVESFVTETSLSISADNNVFGDPCGGVSKRLHVVLIIELLPANGSSESETVSPITESTTVSPETESPTTSTESETVSTPVVPIPQPSPEPSPQPQPVQPEPAPVQPVEPSPQPTPEPSVEPTPQPTPTPEVTPSPEPSPEPPVAEPTPTPTPEPTPEPTSEPTPTPEPKPTPTPTTIPTVTPSPTPTPIPTPIVPEPRPEPTKEPTPTENPVVVEIKEPITAENIAAVVAELATIAPQQLTQEQQTLITEAALETFITAEQGSAEYEAALDALLVVAQADDIVIDEELAAIPLLGNAAVAAAEVFNALGNAGADMSPQVREQSEKVVIASVIVANIAITATQAAASAAVAAARRP